MFSYMRKVDYKTYEEEHNKNKTLLTKQKILPNTLVNIAQCQTASFLLLWADSYTPVPVSQPRYRHYKISLKTIYYFPFSCQVYIGYFAISKFFIRPLNLKFFYNMRSLHDCNLVLMEKKYLITQNYCECLQYVFSFRSEVRVAKGKDQERSPFSSTTN